MGVSEKRVAPMSRITLALEAGTGPGRMDLTESPQAYSFIFGLGVEGLSPFECRLIDRPVGEEIEMEIRSQEVPLAFEHLRPPLLCQLGDRASFTLKARIEAVAPAEQREIVRAMARLGGCGENCDCGCGGH